MKNFIILILLQLPFLAISQFICEYDTTGQYVTKELSDCGNTINYAPNEDFPEHTPIYTIRVNIHFILSNDDSNPSNFTETWDGVNQSNNLTGYGYANSLINTAIYRLINSKMNLLPNNSTPVLQTRYKYVLNKVLFHKLTNYYFASNSGSTLNNTYGEDFGYATNVFILVKQNNFGANPTVGGDANMSGNRWVRMFGAWEQYYVGINNGINLNGLWMVSSLLNHEIGHNLSLSHTLMTNYGSCVNTDADGCSDTPTRAEVLALGLPDPCSWSNSNNRMDYNSSSNAFTPCQLGKIHYTLMHGLRNFIVEDYCNNDNSYTYINTGSNITWASRKIFYGNILIENNSILTIKCNINMPSQATITVQSGAKLIIDGGLITSSCSDLWQGIIAEPGSTIELKNGATIENAILAIDAQGDATVKAFNSNFTNNITAIKIKSLNDGTVSSTNSIRKCNFTTTDFLSSIGEHPEQFIKLDGLENINIQGNTFKNLNSDDYSISERGIGIYANYSAMNITPYCPTITQEGQPCTNETPSTFENLFYGIYLDYANLQKVTIDRNQFTNNTRSVYAYGINNTSITRNNFSIGEPLVTEAYNSDLITGYYTTDMIAYGIYLSFSTGYTIEENNFTTIYEKQGKVGLGVYQSGKNPNQIYKNDFNGLRYALYALGENGSSSTNPTIGSRGLQLRCNSNDKNIFDFISMNQGAVASYQGYYNNPTGNTFTPMSCSSGGKNIYGYINSYNYYSGNSTMIPTCKSSTVWAYQSSIPFTTMDEVCPSSFSTGKGITTILTEYTNKSLSVEQVNSQFSTLVDANNTDWFLKKITQNHNPSNMKKKLLEASPWLSDTVMVSLIQKENYFAATDLTEVLVSNPQSATSPIVQESLDSMTTPLPYTLRMQIKANDTVLSPKAEMEAQLSSLYNDKEYYANQIINYFLNDTLPGAKDSLINFLASQNTLDFDYKLFLYPLILTR